MKDKILNFIMVALIILAISMVAFKTFPKDVQNNVYDNFNYLKSNIFMPLNQHSKEHKIKVNVNKKQSLNSAEPDFEPYMINLQKEIKANWNPPKGDKSKRVVLLFKIARNGKLLKVKVFKSSGIVEVDKAALTAVVLTAPFKSLPKEFKGKSVDIQFTFDYNVWNKKSGKI